MLFRSLPATPDLWEEIAALQRDPDARAPGAWIDRSIARHITSTRAGLNRAVTRMTRALEKA